MGDGGSLTRANASRSQLFIYPIVSSLIAPRSPNLEANAWISVSRATRSEVHVVPRR